MPAIRYEHRGNTVVMLVGHGGSFTVATCFSDAWAEVIAGLLQADWESETTGEAAG